MWKNNTKGVKALCLLLLSLPSRDLTLQGGNTRRKNKEKQINYYNRGLLKKYVPSVMAKRRGNFSRSGVMSLPGASK